MERGYQSGSLVSFREREWVVQPSDDEDVLRLKPLGGHEVESTGVYLPLDGTRVRPAQFPLPTNEDLGTLRSGRLLYDAARLALRTGAGPFRSFGRLSVRPRAYQLVPLIMALRQEVVRLLIADDVGIGKTVEALLIVRELLDRSVIKSFAVVCPPHLCDQWQSEIESKFGIEAHVVKSSTVAQLDRLNMSSASDQFWERFKFTVVSIDYLKRDTRRAVFLSQCPDLVIVDEAHTCASADATKKSQQQRHALVKDISQKTPEKHLLLLTATPHSGKEEAFQSLLGLLRPEFGSVVVAEADQSTRRKLARHFVQRRRADLQDEWSEEGKFPHRGNPVELSYAFSGPYAEAFQQVRSLARSYAQGDGQSSSNQQRMRYWTALGLLRGMVSSPAAGASMLENRAARISEREADDEDLIDNLVDDIRDDMSDSDADTRDVEPTELAAATAFESTQEKSLKRVAKGLTSLSNLTDDVKASTLLDHLLSLLEEGFRPIVFCRFIKTAVYLEEVLKPKLEKEIPGILVEAVTSILNDEQRRERVNHLGTGKHRVLIATDCLSEGINLQDHFDAVVHYDLPWNPNRIEQREGRVDRFGQKSKEVRVAMMVGQNTVDRTVMRILLRKAAEIRKETGVTIPFPEDSRSMIDMLTENVLFDDTRGEQQSLFVEKIESDYQLAADRERRSRTIFAQNPDNLKASDIAPDLEETDRTLGSPEHVERFVVNALSERYRVQVTPIKSTDTGYYIYLNGLPSALRAQLPESLQSQEKIRVGFEAPLPEGYLHLGRTHPFVAHLSAMTLKDALPSENSEVSRAAVVVTSSVQLQTTICLFRVRNVISDLRGREEIIAEELHAWGFTGSVSNPTVIAPEEVTSLLYDAVPTGDAPRPLQQRRLEEVVAYLDSADMQLDEITRERTQRLIEQHERYQKTIGGRGVQGVEPVLPPDLLGIYILLPDNA